MSDCYCSPARPPELPDAAAEAAVAAEVATSTVLRRSTPGIPITRHRNRRLLGYPSNHRKSRAENKKRLRNTEPLASFCTTVFAKKSDRLRRRPLHELADRSVR